MGQVPGRAALLLIGDGRLAGHLNYYFRAKQLPVTQWSRRRGVAGPGGPGTPEARIAGSRGDPWAALPGLVAAADRVLLAIRDDAIPDFMRAYRRDTNAVWVHFSGSVVVAGAWTAHPLSTFAGPPYALEVYEAIPFIVEREGPPLGELVPGLDNPSAAIPRADKPLYHALCVSAGNFTQLVWQQLFRHFEDRLGLTPELALPYLRQTCRSLERGPGPDLLTGPIARRDHGTVRRNLEALRATGLNELAGVYEAFLRLADPQLLETTP